MCALRILKAKRIRGGGVNGCKLEIPLPPKKEPFRKPMDVAWLENLVDQLVETIFQEPAMNFYDVMTDILSRPLADEAIARKFTSRPVRWLSADSMLEFLRRERVVYFEQFGGPLNPEQVTLLRVLGSGQNGFVVKYKTGVLVCDGVKGGSNKDA